MTLRMTLMDNLDVMVQAGDSAGEAPVHVLTKLDGWTGNGPAVRAAKTLRLGNGSIDEQTRRTGRQITIAGTSVLRDRAETWAFERVISGLFSDGESGDLIIHQDADPYGAVVQLDGPAKIDTNTDNLSVTWELPLYAPDPYIYGPPRTVGLTPADSGGGLQFPLNQGPGNTMVFLGATGDPAANLVNNGNAEAWPTFEIVGSFPAGFRIQLGQDVIEYPYAVFPASPVTVDMRGHVWVNGADQQGQLRRRGWATVAPHSAGTATFTPLQANGLGVCNATIQDTYL